MGVAGCCWFRQLCIGVLWEFVRVLTLYLLGTCDRFGCFCRFSAHEAKKKVAMLKGAAAVRAERRRGRSEEQLAAQTGHLEAELAPVRRRAVLQRLDGASLSIIELINFLKAENAELRTVVR
jgi:hypothetical protein